MSQRLNRSSLLINVFTVAMPLFAQDRASTASEQPPRPTMLFDSTNSIIENESKILVEDLNKFLGSLRPVKTSLKVAGLLDLRDSYNKHIENSVVIGAYGLKEASISYKAVLAHEYAHAALYEYFKAPNTKFDLIQFRNRLRPYNELFADLVAALFFNDPQIMHKAITYRNASYSFRDFSQSLDLSTWKLEDEPGMPAYYYRALDPARSEIWKLLKNSTADTPLLLKIFLEATREHLLSSEAKGEDEDSEPNGITVNKEFVELIRLGLQ